MKKNGILTRVHVNQHIVKQNTRSGSNYPCITVKNSKGNTYYHKVFLSGNWELKQEMDNPLSCGARVYLEGYYNGNNLTGVMLG